VQATSLQCEAGVILKPLEPANADELFQLVDSNRARLRQWLPWLDQNTKATDSAKFIEITQADAARGAGFVFGIWVDGELAGVASLLALNKANRFGSIGYWVGKKFAGRSLARKASRALVDFGFQTLNLNRIEIRCATGNLSSQRVAEGLGFQFEGIARQGENLYGQFVDHKVYSMLAGDC